MQHQYRTFDPSGLNGADKIAALMLAIFPIDREYVGALLKRFSDADLVRITKSASELGSVPPGVLNSLLNEFSQQLNAGPGVLGGSVDAQNLFDAAHPGSDMDQLLTVKEKAPPLTLWEKLTTLDRKVLTKVIDEMDPQAAAYVLSQLPSASIANCVESLDEERSADLMARIIRMEEPGPLAIQCIEEALSNVVDAKPTDEDALYNQIAEALNLLSPEMSESLINHLRVKVPDEVKQIEKSLFDFRDVITLSETARTAVMKRVDSEELIVALNGADEELVEAFLSTLGARARKMIEQELNDARQVAKSAIAASRKNISAVVLKMIQSGEILRDDSDEE